MAAGRRMGNGQPKGTFVLLKTRAREKRYRRLSGWIPAQGACGSPVGYQTHPAD